MLHLQKGLEELVAHDAADVPRAPAVEGRQLLLEDHLQQPAVPVLVVLIPVAVAVAVEPLTI